MPARSPDAAPEQIEGEPPAQHEPSVDGSGEPETEPRPPTEAALATPPEPEPEPEPEPIERRRALRPLMAYVEPKLGTDFRAKIQHGEVFELLERVEGEECRGDGWGRVGTAAFVCLHHTEVTTDEATTLPASLPDQLAPFLYARLQPKDHSGKNPPAPRWRSRAAMRNGAEPESFLEPEHDYAFVQRRRFRGGAVLYAHNGRVVREADIKRMKPSEFAGRDTLARPIPAGAVMGWSITWPRATVRAEASPEAPEVGGLPLHAELLAHDEPTRHGGEDWYPVSEPVEGWVLASEIRRWVPMAPPAGLEPEQVWLDVDLEQQTLALQRGTTPEFVTLVSSGNWKHATPTGLFRVEAKWAWADMRSRAGDDETYFVEGVPWVLYFRGRYALHGTFWHNRFGRRTSHGCVNLSAHDARWVYERTTPTARPGWVVTYEHLREPGTLVRIRKGQQRPPDRREPLTGS